MADEAGSVPETQLTWDVFVTPEFKVVSSDLPPGLDTRTWAPTTATLISGDTDAVLVDAMLTINQAEALANWVEAKGKNLTTVYVTHGHGDHFFGLAQILDRFPKARAVATPAAIEVMREQSDPSTIKRYWEPILPGQIPPELRVPEPLDGEHLYLQGHTLTPIEVGHTDTKATTCLYVPSVSLIVAGDAVYNGTHIFLGESDARERDEWRTALDTIAALAPTAVVAGHKPAAADDSPRHIEGTRRYLDSFDRAAAAADDATGLYTAMLREYPDYASPGTLWSSAKTNMSRRS